MKYLYAILLVLTLGLTEAQSGVYRLKVMSWRCQVLSRGAIVTGNVVNISSRPMTDLRANVRVTGRGLRMVSTSALIKDRYLQPGEVSTFEIRMRTNFEPNGRCELWFRNAQAIQIPTQVPNPK